MVGAVPEASEGAAAPDSEAFEGFIAYLRTLGFRVGVDHVIKLHRVVASLDENTVPKDLELRLCPLFATNADQQELFYTAFENYFSLFFGPPARELKQPAMVLRGRQSAYRWALVAAVLGILVIMSLALLRDSTGFSLQFGVAALGNAPVVPGALYGQFHYQIPTMEWLPWLAMALVSALCLIYQVRPRWALNQTPEPLYHPGPRDLRGLFDSAELRAAALQLRRRRPSQAEALDIDGSIDSTIRAQGNFQCVYRPRPSAPEYLILIDSAGPRDHQAAVFSEMACRVAEENVHTSVWFYNGDPRFCFAEGRRESAYLTELRSRYPESALVMMGVGAEMINTSTGEGARWLPIFESWSRRILLTPAPAETYTPLPLRTWFVAAPSTPAGLAAAVAATEKADSRVPIAGNWPVAVPWTGGSWKSLRRHLGPRRFTWVCGCAVYPELEWALTMRMGEAFLGPAAWELENILAIAALPWFRSGVVPAHTRRKLAGILSGADRCKAAEVVREYVAIAHPESRIRPRVGRRVDLTAVRLDSPRKFAQWLASPLRQTVIVRSDQLALGRVSRLFWARLLRIATAAVIGAMAWMVFDRWPNPHRDATINVPLPGGAMTAPPAPRQAPVPATDRGRRTPDQFVAPRAVRPFQPPPGAAPAAGPQPEIAPPPLSGTSTVVPTADPLAGLMIPEPPLASPAKPGQSIGSLLGASVELKYKDAKLYRFVDFDALPSDVQRLFANTAPSKDGAAAYNRMKGQPAELAYLLNNLAKARVVLPGGRELISYFTGIDKGGYYSEVEAGPGVLAELNQMVAIGAMSRASAAVPTDITALYVTREPGSDLRIGVKTPTSGTGPLVLELLIGDGNGISGDLRTAIRAITGIPNLISIYNRLIRQKLEIWYRVGSACDLNGDGMINNADVQLILNQVLGTTPAVTDLNGDGAVNILDLQLEVNAADSGVCQADGPLPPPTGARGVVR